MITGCRKLVCKALLETFRADFVFSIVVKTPQILRNLYIVQNSDILIVGEIIPQIEMQNILMKFVVSDSQQVYVGRVRRKFANVLNGNIHKAARSVVATVNKNSDIQAITHRQKLVQHQSKVICRACFGRRNW